MARADVVEGRGYGLVKFASAKGAKAAISELHDSGAPAWVFGVGVRLGLACLAWHSLTQRLLSASELEGKTIVVRADKGGGGKGGGGGRRGGGDEEEGEDGYTYSGRETGWVRPTGADFDDAPPADPKGSGALAR